MVKGLAMCVSNVHDGSTNMYIKLWRGRVLSGLHEDEMNWHGRIYKGLPGVLDPLYHGYRGIRVIMDDVGVINIGSLNDLR